MAFTAGVKKTVGDLLTAAQWNNYYGASSSVDFLKTEADKIDDVSQAQPARSVGTNYQNNSGKIRLVTIVMNVGAGELCNFRIGSSSPPGTYVVLMENASASAMVFSGSFLVPLSWYYKVVVGDGPPTLRKWTEWDTH